MSTTSRWTSAPIAICIATGAASNFAKLTPTGSASKFRSAIETAGLRDFYAALLSACYSAAADCRNPPRNICCPSRARSRFLFKMDFAEAEYIARVRSRRQRSLQLPAYRLADEGKDERSSSRTWDAVWKPRPLG